MKKINSNNIWIAALKDYETFRIDNTAIAVTTNGIVKYNGDAVMGKGIAKQCNDMFNIAPLLGKYLKMYGNRVFNMGSYIYDETDGCGERINVKTFKSPQEDSIEYQILSFINVITFPTKHNWKDNSDIELIKTSCKQITEVCNKFNIGTCYIPPVGCGCGNLNWTDEVEPIISNLLDDRFIAVI